MNLFEFVYNNSDIAYQNIRNCLHRQERQIRDTLEAMWERYRAYADPDFRAAFARDPDARFWEMFLGCALLDAGKTLLRTKERKRGGGQPDICVLDGEQRIWIEAIAPGCGADGPDQVRGPRPINEGGGAEYAPTRQVQLRVTSALLDKSKKIKEYLGNKTINEDDVRVIAINAGRFGIYASEYPSPTIISCLFPVGDHYVKVDKETGDIVDQGFVFSMDIKKSHNKLIPRTAFFGEQYSHISGIIWSRIGLGNMSRDVRPVTFVHNPNADIPMKENWGVWDHEFVMRDKGQYYEIVDILSAPIKQQDSE